MATARWGRRLGPLVLVLALLATLVPTATVAAHADPGLEAGFVERINQERAAQGVSALRTASDLTSVARAHSEVMASRSELHHQPDLGGSVGGWRKVGENVGRGPSVDSIHGAFMDSPGHARNILDPDWTEVGVGVVVRDGRIWVTELFRLPSGSTSPAGETAPSEPASRPAREPVEPAGEGGVPSPDPAPAAAGPGGSASGSEARGSDDEPAPDEVLEPVGPPFDRLTVTLARLEAAEQGRTLDEVLADG